MLFDPFSGKFGKRLIKTSGCLSPMPGDRHACMGGDFYEAVDVMADTSGAIWCAICNVDGAKFVGTD